MPEAAGGGGAGAGAAGGPRGLLGGGGVRAATFNLAGGAGPGPGRALLERVLAGAAGEGDGGGRGPDLVAVGAQEVGAHDVWETDVLAAAREAEGGLTPVGGSALSLGGMSLVVLARADVQSKIVGVRTSGVATGVGNIFANKGGLGVQILMKRGVGDKRPPMKINFVSSHLAAHAERVEGRNADFLRIARRLFRGEDCTQDCDVVFWVGDLNYRVDGNRRGMDKVIGLGMRDVMIANDQLKIERKKGRAFQGFSEGPLNFPPTYKYDLKSDNYDTSSKCRVPSWTDRVLWRVNPAGRGRAAAVTLCEYTSLDEIRCSDHRPVMASFGLEFPEE